MRGWKGGRKEGRKKGVGVVGTDIWGGVKVL